MLLSQVLLNYIARGMDLLTSVRTPRVHHQYFPSLLQLEHGATLHPVNVISVDADVRAALVARHQTLLQANTTAITQFISVDPDSGLLTGVSDPRKDGTPAAV